MQPLVSVLLPVYNGEAYVREAIESVLAQDYPHFEFIIVDNASTDRTPAILAEYAAEPGVRVVRNKKIMPRLENFMKAFSQAAGESDWLKFIGDDDRLLPGCLSEMVRAGKKGKKVGLVSSRYYLGDELIKGILPSGQEFIEGPKLLRRLLLEPPARPVVYSPASLMISHQAYKELGPIRTDLLHADSELFYRILNRYNFAFVHKPLTVTGYHSESGQAGSTEKGYTFLEAYLIRYHNLEYYDNLELTVSELEKIKYNLVNDSVGFMLGRLARGDFKSAWSHLAQIPPTLLYHLPLSLAYFTGLAVKKLLRGEKIKSLK
ncbi:MAG: glycosyltransferase [Bacillota bacterium]